MRTLYTAGVFHPEGPTFLELMHQALVSTERGYDLIAPKFDRTPFRTPDPVLAALAAKIGPVDAGLDVCCGTGAATVHLKPLCRKRVAGVDFSEGMLAEARRRVEAAPGAAAVDLRVGDARKLPFDAEFDVVTSVGAFGHIVREDEDAFVSGIARALRKGGRFVFATTPRPKPTQAWWWMAHGFNAAMRVRNKVLTSSQFIMYYLTFLWPDVRALLERHGFDVVATTGDCPAPYQKVVLVVATKR